MSGILIVGDLHLDKGLSIGKPSTGLGLNSRIQDKYNLLDWVLEQCIALNVTLLIFTGDIYENTQPDYAVTDRFIQWCKACQSYNIDIAIIVGNHDFVRSGLNYFSPLNLLNSAEIENVTVYNNITNIYYNNIGITLMPFRDKKSLECQTIPQAVSKLQDMFTWANQEIPSHYTKVMVGHLAIEGSLFVGDEVDDLANEIMCPISLFHNYDYVWMGHIHKPQVLNKKPYVAHVGSLDISDFGEVDHKKVAIHLDANQPQFYQELPLPCRPLRKIKVIIPEQEDPTPFVLDEIEKLSVSNSFKHAIVKVEIQLNSTGINVNRSEINKKLSELGVFHICNFTETRVSVVVPEEKRKKIDNTIEPQLAVKLFIESEAFVNETSEDKQEIYNMCLDIIKEYHWE